MNKTILLIPILLLLGCKAEDELMNFAKPCKDLPTFTYKGWIYNTVQIGGQCWMKENLNVGIMVPGTSQQSDNGIIEKYCYNNEPDSCARYGGLYLWNEMMSYDTQNLRGICPAGWHVPTDEEWKILEGTVDGVYGVGNSLWDQSWEGVRGYDAGTNLKDKSWWDAGCSGTDLFGFSGLPGGYRSFDGSFSLPGDDGGFFWTSTKFKNLNAWAWGRCLQCSQKGVARITFSERGCSVRCIQGEVDTIPADTNEIIPVDTNKIEIFFTGIDDLSYVQLDSVRVIMNLAGDLQITLVWPDTSLDLKQIGYTHQQLLLVGYAGILESGILDDSVAENKTYTFQFANNISCPGTPTVEYEGQVYNTIQIFSQCWLKENLNAGTMIDATIEQSDNGTIEKYCYNNKSDSCTKYGGLYQWDEMMQYTTQQGTRGICPPGWHLPTDEEWKVLEGAVDSQYGIGDIRWDEWGHRGYNAGTNLKTTSGWNYGGNGTDLFGFSGLPGGYRTNYGSFNYVGYYGYWWTSTQYDNNLGCFHYIGYNYPEVYRNKNLGVDCGYSVHCLRDDF